MYICKVNFNIILKKFEKLKKSDNQNGFRAVQNDFRLRRYLGNETNRDNNLRADSEEIFLVLF